MVIARMKIDRTGGADDTRPFLRLIPRQDLHSP